MPSADSDPDSVDTYIAEAPEYARPILRKLRELIHATDPKIEEVIRWGGPAFRKRGLICGMAAFKQHVNLYFFQGAQLKDPGGVLTLGEGNASGRRLQLRTEKEIPINKLRGLLREALALDATEKEKANPRPRRPELPIPAELSGALKGEPKATAFFEALPPSCKREYIEWISSAKREETRMRRVGQTLKMLKAGKRRNEEYR